jgi:hypothetical protein
MARSPFVTTMTSYSVTSDLNAGVGVGRELQAGQFLLRKGGP